MTFGSGPEAESGRIWWMYDRYPGGSAPFLWERIPDDQWMDMTFAVQEGAWTATIPLDPAASSIEFFTNQGLVVDGFQTYRSSPYTRVGLGPVAGVAELPEVARAPLETPDSSGGNVGLLIAITIAAIIGAIAFGFMAWCVTKHRATKVIRWAHSGPSAGRSPGFDRRARKDAGGRERQGSVPGPYR